MGYCTSMDKGNSKNTMPELGLLKNLPKAERQKGRANTMPKSFVACYKTLSRDRLLEIKRNYANVVGIYMWYNKINGAVA
jgi:hypothetical protein